jgi:uncharacterized protein DUF6717
MTASRKKKSWWPLYAAVLVVGAAGLAYAYNRGAPPPANAIQIITPYMYKGTWVFDDVRANLRREPFVSGVPEIIDKLVERIPDAASGFRLYFSASPFPEHMDSFIRTKPQWGGYWYRSSETHAKGWLCPAIFKFFREAPETIYVKAEPKDWGA